MKTNEIKKQLRDQLTWNYYYYNVIDESGYIVASFDNLNDAHAYVKSNKTHMPLLHLFIQKCHNISYII